MLRKSEERKAIKFFHKVDEEFLKSNIINIYTLAANVEKIEKRVLKKVS